MYDSHHPNHGVYCLIAEEIHVDYKKMEALIKDLDPLGQFENPVAHLTAITSSFQVGCLVCRRHRLTTVAFIVTKMRSSRLP